jgi:hypothetical protein
MNQGIRDFVHCQTIAVVGASRTGKKFGNMAYRDLKKRGYDVLAVHPTAQTLDGDTCYASLHDLPRTPDGVLISLPPDKVTPVLRDAAELGIRHVWLQQGAESPEALALSKELGLNVAYGTCILMYMQPVRSFHGWHRAAARLFGRLEPTDKVTPQMLAERRLKTADPRAMDLLDDEAVELLRNTQIK